MILRDTMTSPVRLKTSVYLAIPDEVECNAIILDFPDNYVATRCQSMNDLFTCISHSQPDLILCHDDLIKDEKISLIATIKAATKSTRILVIGAGRTIDGQIAVLKQGARGYFDNHLPADKLHFAIQGILHGEVWVERHAISSLIDELTQASVPEISQKQQDLLATLTPKEVEVATLVSHGATNKMIANKMAITERTVKAHLTTIFQKLAISDRLALAIFFRDLR